MLMLGMSFGDDEFADINKDSSVASSSTSADAVPIDVETAPRKTFVLNGDISGKYVA